MDKQRGIAHILFLVLIVSAAVLVYVLFIKNGVNLPSLPGGAKEATQVSVKTEYKNPFDKKTQYVNPFDQYKSPFLSLE